MKHQSVQIFLYSLTILLIGTSVVLPAEVAASGGVQNVSSTNIKLNEDQYFRKISMSLCGIPPTIVEYTDFQKASDRNVYLSEYIDNCLKSKAYMDKFSAFFTEQLQLKISGVPTTITSIYKYFFESILKSNLSIDTLYSSHTIPAIRNDDSYTKYELQHFKALLDRKLVVTSTDNKGFMWITNKNVFLNGFVDPNYYPYIVGLFSTSAYIESFSKKISNQNRGRAAGVLRALFCEDLKIGSLIDSDLNDLPSLEDEIKNQPDQNLITSSSNQKEIPHQVHFSEKTCRGCHIKIDNVAKNFANSFGVVSPIKNKGELAFTTLDGSTKRFKTHGLGDLVRKAVRQPEYVQCQIQRFWTLLVGADVPISSARMQDLKDVFEKVRRRPRDFAHYIVTLPEYREVPQATKSSTYDYVRPIFNECQNCHNDEPLAPTLTDLEVYRETNGKLILQIMESIQMHQNKNYKKIMPPRKSDPLTQDEKNKLSEWFFSGAKDINGINQISPSSLRSKGFVETQTYKISQEPQFYRYLSDADLMNTLEKLFLHRKQLQLEEIRDRKQLEEIRDREFKIEQCIRSYKYFQLLACLYEYMDIDPLFIQQLKILYENKIINRIPLNIQKKILSGLIVSYYLGPNILPPEEFAAFVEKINKNINWQINSDGILIESTNLRQILFMIITSDYYLIY